MQEEERELRDNYCPDVSEVKTDGILIDKVTSEMLDSIGIKSLPGVSFGKPSERRQRSRTQFRRPRPNAARRQ